MYFLINEKPAWTYSFVRYRISQARYGFFRNGLKIASLKRVEKLNITGTDIMYSTKVILRSSPAVLLVITLWLSVGCTDSTPQNQAQSTPDNTAATMAAIKAANAPSKPKQNQGVVKTVKMGGGYTYAMVDIGGDDFWLATTMTALQPGQEILSTRNLIRFCLLTG
jgi:hypothetical protein